MKRSVRLTIGLALLVTACMAVAGTARTVPSSSAASSSHSPSTRDLTEATAALNRYLAHGHQTAELLNTHRPAVAGGPTIASSYNWSGYADTSSTDGVFTQVAGSWVTPKVTCNAEDTITSEWVGLDGWTSTTVEQDGTLGWCFEGTAHYYTWYEMYPAGTITVGATLKPGDAITASVGRAGTKYTLKVTDATNTANSFTEIATCGTSTCLATSAEWIAERPAFSIGIAPLAHYSNWRVNGAKETAGGVVGTISSYPTYDQITAIDATDSYPLDKTSALKTPAQFATSWLNSY